MLSDFRIAARSLAKTPGFAAIVIGILALGIGASTAIFSVVNAVLLRPLAYHDARRLVQVQSQHPEQGVSVLAPATFGDLAREAKSFSALGAQEYYYFNLTKTAAPTRITGIQATADYFRLFGVAPALGRTWNPDETRAGAAPVVVLGDRIWRSQFNARDSILGEQITLDDVAYTVIGVMPASFMDPWGNAQLWVPMPLNEKTLSDRTARYWSSFARLADGVTLAQAAAELNTFGLRLQQAYPQNYRGWTLNVADLHGLVVGDYRTGLLVVLGAVTCVMLITCANVAGLSVVRAIGRRKELAIRAALGASGGRLMRQLLGESLLLSLAGGSLGVLVANWGVSAILVIVIVGDGWLPRSGEIGINTPVLLAALALTLVTGIAFGLAPAWSASRTDANDALKDGAGRGSSGPASRRLRSGLVVIELSLALVLLVAAGLLGRSFASVLGKNPGLRTDHVLTLGLSLSSKRYDSPDKRRDFYLRVEQAVAALPGVAATGFTQTMPFTWGIPATLVPVGASNVSDQTAPQAYYDSVGANFFKAAGIPLIAGRTFNTADVPGAPPSVVISAATARRFFGHENPIGRRLRATDPTQTAQFEIIGVVGDVLRTGLATTDVPLQIYRPIAQRPTAFATLMVQTHLPPEAVAKSVQAAIWSIDSDQAIESISPLSALVSNSVTQPRLYLTLFSLFAGIALTLAAIGLYGLVAYGVAQRTREFGIRTALGAPAGSILRLVMREGANLIMLGLAFGLAGAFGTARLLQSMIFETSVHDPAIFVLVPIALGTVATFACWLPARRAIRIDPVVALRAE
jgi:putative ABC transport system permease protein